MEPSQNQQKDLARFLVLGHASDKSSVSPLNDASIELVSATERLCFRETGFAERRKPYGKGPIASIVPLQRQTSRAKGRQYGAFLRALGKFSVRESAWWRTQSLSNPALQRNSLLTGELLTSADAAIVALRRRFLSAAKGLKDGNEPAQLSQPQAYRVRSCQLALPRDIDIAAGAKQAMTVL